MATRFTNPFPRFFADNSALLSGGKLNFYEDDGGTTLKDTYSDNALSVPNTNPVILTASGVIPDIFLDGTYRVTLDNSDDVQIDEADNVNAGAGDFSAWSNWDSGVDYGFGPSVIVTGSNGKYYKSLQTPNLGNDPISSPTFWGRVYLISDTDPKQGGPLDSNSYQIQWSKGADVVSAAALPVLTDGNYFDVTGTTTITSINTTKVGNIIKLHFDAALTLTHHATDLILPSGANITTAAGDEAEFVEYATGDYRCTNYSRADGSSLVSEGSLVLISSADASNDSSIEFTGIDNTYDEYEVHLLNVIPATDSVQLYLRTSSDGGSSFDSGASDYSYGNIQLAAATVTGTNNATAAFVLVNSDNGSSANELGTSCTVRLIRPSEATYTNVFADGARTNSSAENGPFITSGTRLSAAAVNAIQIFFSSGNVESGKLALYGVKRQ